MTVENDRDVRALMEIGQICGLALQYMLKKVEPGMKTKDLDALGEAYITKFGARSAPILAYKFPGFTCISINDEAAHGIPDDYVIQPGDMVNVDVCAELNGYIADTGASIPMPPVSVEYEQLCHYTQIALKKGCEAAVAGRRLNVIGKAIEKVAKQGGYTVIRELSGHGVGRTIHENPSVPNYYTRRAKQKMKEGMVFTIEPFFSLGNGKVYTADDEWTVCSEDGTVAAQYEHTVIITNDQPILVTAV